MNKESTPRVDFDLTIFTDSKYFLGMIKIGLFLTHCCSNILFLVLKKDKHTNIQNNL